MGCPNRAGESFNDLLGKEFQYGGRGPERYDCYGLCIEVRRRLGLHTPAHYESVTGGACIDHRMKEALGELFFPLEKPEPGCLVTFMLRPPYTTHVGVVLLDRYRFIHITRQTRVAIERLDIDPWARKISGFWELRHA